jgi:hypothetical protein
MRSVFSVGLLQPPRGFGEGADLLGVDDGHVDAGLQKGGGDPAVVPPRRFDDDQADLVLEQRLDEPGDARVVVADAEVPLDGVDEQVELRFGHVDAGDGRGGVGQRFVLHGGFPALRMRTAPRGRVRTPARRVQPAVRVSRTRRATIKLRDGVHAGARARTICRPPPLRGLLATLRSPRSGMRH